MGVVVVVVLIIGAAKGVLQGRERSAHAAATPAPAARFVVADVLMDQSCTQLGDFCVTVHCTYQNAGPVAGAKRVVASLRTESGTEVGAHGANLTLLPGGTQRVSFNFSEASLDDGGGYRARCDVADPAQGSAE